MSVSNDVVKIVGNTTLGVAGGSVSIWLNSVNEILSTLVALATLVYLIVSISKKLKQ
jgi:hypothetical protein